MEQDNTQTQESTASVELSQLERDYMYNLAVKHVVVENYAQAIPIFQLLVTLDGNNDMYCKALAGSLQASAKHFEAYFYYQAAYVINNDTNQDCLFYGAVCLYNCGVKAEAHSMLDSFIKNPGEYSHLLAKAKLYLKLTNSDSN